MEHHISFAKQIEIYFGKCTRIFRSEKGWKNFISTAIILLLVCTVTGEEMFLEASPTQKGSFAIVCACIWIGVFNSIRSICSERAIIKREHRTGLKISSYIAAHVLFEMLVCMVECIIVTTIVCLKNRSNLPGSGVLMPAALELFIDFYLILVSSDLLGIFISSIVHSENTAMTIMPFVLIAKMVFAGVIFQLEGFSKWLSSLMISRWGLAAICVTVDINGMSPLPNAENDFTYTVANQLKLWGTLCLFSLVFIICSIIFLSGVDRDKR